MRKLFFIFISLLFFNKSIAATVIRINVESVIRNQIDEGLILSSEHHFSRKMISGETLAERLNENMGIELTVFFDEDKTAKIAPGHKVTITGRVNFKSFDQLNTIEVPKFSVDLLEKKFINIKMNNKKSIDLKFYTMVENFDDI